MKFILFAAGTTAAALMTQPAEAALRGVMRRLTQMERLKSHRACAEREMVRNPGNSDAWKLHLSDLKKRQKDLAKQLFEAEAGKGLGHGTLG